MLNTLSADARPISIYAHDLRSMCRQARSQTLFGDEDGSVAVVEHEGDALLRIGGVERQVGRARFEDA
jgi:hypothetical protein